MKCRAIDANIILRFLLGEPPLVVCPGADGGSIRADSSTAIHRHRAGRFSLHAANGRASWHYPGTGWRVFPVL